MKEKQKGKYPAIMLVPIAELRLSDAFIAKSGEMGLATIGEIADVGWGRLHQMEGFSYDWFDELVRFMDSRGLLHYLERR